MRRIWLIIWLNGLALAAGCATHTEGHPEDTLYARMMEASSHLFAKDYAAAEAAYRVVLERAPESARARARLAEALAEQERFEEAARELRTALRFSLAAQQLDPARTDEGLRAEMGDLALQHGWWRLAGEVVRALPKARDPLVLPAIAGLARLGAWAEVEDLLPRAERPTLLLFLTGAWLTGTDEEADAVVGLLPRLAKVSPDPLVLAALAELRLAEGRWAEALGLWKRALERGELEGLRTRVEALEAGLAR